MSTLGVDDDLDEWFVVIDESVENPEDQLDEVPALSGAPAILLRRVKELIPTWRSLGITDEDTFAGFQHGRLWVGIDIDATDAGASIGFVRVEVTDTEWVGARISSSRGTQPKLEDAYPKEQVGGPIADDRSGADEAVRWLEAQLRRPVHRYVWRDQGRVVAESWQLEDSGRELVVSGAPHLRGDPGAAESVRVRS